jgi:hypothetical protein
MPGNLNIRLSGQRVKGLPCNYGVWRSAYPAYSRFLNAFNT